VDSLESLVMLVKFLPEISGCSNTETPPYLRPWMEFCKMQACEDAGVATDKMHDRSVRLKVQTGVT